MPRPLVLSMQQSLDGFVATQTGDVSWIMPQFDEHFTRSQVAMLGAAGLHLMGRKAYGEMAEHWMKSKEPFAPPMNDIPKLVFSKTLAGPKWKRTSVHAGDVATEIRRLKQEDGGYLLAHGGVSFARALSELGLVDEYRMVVHPVTLGAGMAVFPKNLKLRLVRTELFPKGAVALTYVPA